MKLILAIALLTSQLALADAYITGGVGHSRVNHAAGDVGPKDNLDRTIGQIGAGFRINPNVAVEALYHQLETIAYENCSTAPAASGLRYYKPIVSAVTTCAPYDFNPRGYSVSVLAGADVQGFGPFLRLGAFENDHGDSGLIGGVGVSFKNVRVEYQHIKDISLADRYETSVDNVVLSVVF